MIKGLLLMLNDYGLPLTLVSSSTYKAFRTCSSKDSCLSFLSERVVSCFLVKVGAETAHCEQRHLGHIQCWPTIQQ